MWFVLPYLANNVIVGLIGLVACLSAVVTSQNAFVAFTGFFLICANVFSFAQRLSEMAGVTKRLGRMTMFQMFIYLVPAPLRRKKGSNITVKVLHITTLSSALTMAAFVF